MFERFIVSIFGEVLRNVIILFLRKPQYQFLDHSIRYVSDMIPIQNKIISLDPVLIEFLKYFFGRSLRSFWVFYNIFRGTFIKKYLWNGGRILEWLHRFLKQCLKESQIKYPEKNCVWIAVWYFYTTTKRIPCLEQYLIPDTAKNPLSNFLRKRFLGQYVGI